MNYSNKGQVDFEKSGFSYSNYNLIAGNYTQVTVNLVDSMYLPINITNKTDSLSNLTVIILYASQAYSPTSEYHR